MLSSWLSLFMVWILTPSTTASSCMQTHTHPGHVHTVAYTKSDLPSRLGQVCAHISANRGHLRTRTPIRRALLHLQPGCCPRAPTSFLPTGGLILPPAAEGLMPTGARPKAATQEPLCASVLFSTCCFFPVLSLNFKCKMSACVRACICGAVSMRGSWPFKDGHSSQ